jgi:hypothetical protein
MASSDFPRETNPSGPDEGPHDEPPAEVTFTSARDRGLRSPGYRGRRPVVRKVGRPLRPETGGSLGGGDSVQPSVERPAVGEDRLRWAAAIQVRLLKLKPPAASAEVPASSTKSEEYLRESLRIAGETLDTAYHALEQEAKRSRSFTGKEVIATVRALQNEAWWDELLESHQLENPDAAKNAARNLAARIASLDPDSVTPDSDSLERLLIDIAILRAEISSIRQTTGLLSPGKVRTYVSAAYSVASQVMVGLIAASATAEASGAKVVPQVIYSAIGLTAAASLAEIYRRAARGFKAQTVQAQLQEYHRKLIAAITDLSIFVSRLTIRQSSVGDALRIVRNTALAASFLVSHVEQLANACKWPERAERDAYCDVLVMVKALLDKVRGIPSWSPFRDAEEMAQGDRLNREFQRAPEYNQRIRTMERKLRDANARLGEFTGLIDGLRPD